MSYELFAIRYATQPGRIRAANFLGLPPGDPHDALMPMDFFVWVAVGEGRIVLFDTGCDEAGCRRRGHTFLDCPTVGLKALGIDPAAVDTVVSTHLHWDHAGNFEKFPNATFHASPLEIRHAVGPCMCNAYMRAPYDVEHVCRFVRLVYEGRVRFHEAGAEVAPGLHIHPAAGHAAGQLFATVPTRRGRVAVASDAMHYFDNMVLQHPFAVILDVPAYVRGIERVKAEADSPAHIVPGHDPAVLKGYPAFSPETEGRIVRLDVMPQGEAAIAK